jgi:hypothetical protein
VGFTQLIVEVSKETAFDQLLILRDSVNCLSTSLPAKRGVFDPSAYQPIAYGGQSPQDKPFGQFLVEGFDGLLVRKFEQLLVEFGVSQTRLPISGLNKPMSDDGSKKILPSKGTQDASRRQVARARYARRFDVRLVC